MVAVSEDVQVLLLPPNNHMVRTRGDGLRSFRRQRRTMDEFHGEHKTKIVGTLNRARALDTLSAHAEGSGEAELERIKRITEWVPPVVEGAELGLGGLAEHSGFNFSDSGASTDRTDERSHALRRALAAREREHRRAIMRGPRVGKMDITRDGRLAVLGETTASKRSSQAY